SYDAVLTVLVMHHVPPDLRSAACAEMLRVLRPGGALLLGDLQPPTGRLDRLVAAHRFRHPVEANHLDQLADLITAAGAVDVHRHDTAVGWLGLLHARRAATS
ncbi:MAG: class I SAM-dependent methyltransferase, partial [Actinomycetes bacterium]